MMKPPSNKGPSATRLLRKLASLQEFELSAPAPEVGGTQRVRLRAFIPAPVLAHYDRLMARGKKGIVPVRNQCCGGCHMRVPLATLVVLHQDEHLQMCGNCGRYLYLPAAEAAPAPVRATRPAARPIVRRRGKLPELPTGSPVGCKTQKHAAHARSLRRSQNRRAGRSRRAPTAEHQNGPQ